ncbi:TetR family transcriptional regulator [Pelomonas sp. KK5]|uniref:TetR/AcrR family transcriptional regulator n=1 Tax=Pelomonas sp. KK5 TaxID=1855730 RepID=UPI00097C394B|nr:TetR family transcriptional regulator [Pelomonas sp. KK5]
MTSKKTAAPPAPRRGRRPGPGSTRQAVLDAARARFAADGFTATTMRRVAADAQVDVSQVMQFFGSKDALFAAVMAIPPAATEHINTLYEKFDEQLGERVTRGFLAAWEGAPEESEPMMAMLRNAMVNERARDQLRDFIESRLHTGTGEARDDAAALRSGLAASLLMGMVLCRRIIGVPLLAAVEREALVALLAPAIQIVLSPPAEAAG